MSYKNLRALFYSEILWGSWFYNVLYCFIEPLIYFWIVWGVDCCWHLLGVLFFLSSSSAFMQRLSLLALPDCANAPDVFSRTSKRLVVTLLAGCGAHHQHHSSTVSRCLRPTHLVQSGWQWDYGLTCSLGTLLLCCCQKWFDISFQQWR